tara:strand:+ start:1468 stop:4071 length:2604 start_codon:yes stop_codon:yes gene_type:complete
MAAVTTELKVVVKAVGKGELKELEASLNKLAVTAKTKVDTNFKLVSSRLKEIQSTSTTSIKNLRDYRNAWRDIAAQLDISSKEFKEATAEAAKLDAQLAKAEKRKPAGGGRFAGAAKSVGAIAGAGVFGGPEGAIGAAIGAIGGPGAALVGGAIGAQVGQIRKALGATAEYAAELKKLRIALQGVTTSNEQYSQALQAIEQGTKDYAIPQEILTKQFTKLQASVQGAGGNLNDTKTAFNGIVAAVRATGGSLQDVDSALTATAQVFSKGKVSAEELRQQIGERLPGAFSIFAESIGKTPQELDKALEGGKVSLQDFQTFSEALFKRYGENAKTIASGPESAGDRLKVSLGKLSESVGTLLAPIGTAFLKTFEEIVKAIAAATIALNNFLGIGTQGAINKAQREFKAAQKAFDESGLRGTLDPKDLGIRDRARLTRLKNAFNIAQDRLQEAKAAGVGADLQRPEEGNGLPGITPLVDGDKSKGSAEAAAIRVGRALLGIDKMMAKVKSMNANLKLSAEAVGATAEEEIAIKYKQSIQKAIDVTENLNNQLIKYEDTIKDTVPEIREELNKLRMAYVDLADAERAAALQQLADKRFGEKLKGYDFTGEALDAGGKIFADGALDEQAFPAGVDSILNPNKLKESIQEIKKELEELTNPVNQIINAATTIGTAFSDSFKSVIDGSATTQEALAGFFKNISNYFLDMAMQIIQKMITMYVLNQAIGLLPGLGSTGSGFNLSGFGSLSGDSVSGASGFLNAASINPFAKGGIMGQSGPMDLKRYARGGVANSPQLAMFGEGSTPEAYVPLPDGRSIPVTMRGTGSGVQVGAINITVENTGDNLTPAAQKQLAGQVKGIVLSTLANERRSGGML